MTLPVRVCHLFLLRDRSEGETILRKLMYVLVSGVSTSLLLCLAAGTSLSGCSTTPSGGCVTQADCGGKNCVNGTCATSDCSKDDDCKTSKKALCVNGSCQGCIDDSVCDTAGGEKCVANACFKGCQKNADCEYLGKNKSGESAKCLLNSCIIPCVSHKECADDSYCKSQACTKGARPPSKERDELQPCGDVENGKSCKEDTDCKEGICDRNLCWANCLDGLLCKTWSGGSTNYCYKPCKAGCGENVCVTEAQFAEGIEVCMKPVKDQGALFDYNKGTACDTKNGVFSLMPPRGQPGFGQGRCWAFCDANNACEKGRECASLGIKTTDGKFIFACLKPCKATEDCGGIEGLVCKTVTGECTADADCGTIGPCTGGKCTGKDLCIPR